MGVKLSKFPVTAPDGTEFRVTVVERKNGGDDVVELRVYTRRRLFGYRKVSQSRIRSSFFTTYDSSNPNFIQLAKSAVLWHLAKEEKRTSEETRRQRAVEAFAAWDGKIAEEVGAE